MNIIANLKQLNCFKEGKFTLKSGKKSNYYIDLRPLISHPEILKEVSELIYKKIGKFDGFLCGLPYAGIPYAQTISVLHNIPNILLRKERKKHGTGKMIEGTIKTGDDLVIIDDILTTGISIIESLEHLKQFKIKKIIVIVDREEGGLETLKNMGYHVECLFKVSDFTFVNLRDRIRSLMYRKKSNICLSLDLAFTKDILRTIELVKDKVVMIKTHCDIIEDFNADFVKDMVKICKENGILIFEDRKFADIGNTFRKQFTSGIFKIREWCDITDFHGLVGEGIIKEFQECSKKEQGGLLVAEMSNEGNIIDANYKLRIIDMALKNPESIIGFVSQSKICDGFLNFTPGIKLESGCDGKDQIYNTPETAISKGTDIIIVGRGIIEAENILEECEKYRLRAWDCYKNKFPFV